MVRVLKIYIFAANKSREKNSQNLPLAQKNRNFLRNISIFFNFLYILSGCSDRGCVATPFCHCERPIPPPNIPPPLRGRIKGGGINWSVAIHLVGHHLWCHLVGHSLWCHLVGHHLWCHLVGHSSECRLRHPKG